MPQEVVEKSKPRKYKAKPNKNCAKEICIT
jgi:hypothetical protein